MAGLVTKIDYLKETLFAYPDNKRMSSCAQCKLRKPFCNDVCLLGGPLKHIGAIKRHSWFKIIVRWLRHLLTGTYAK